MSSIMDHKEDAIQGVKATVAPRSGKNVTYIVTEAGFEAKGLKDMQPQAQIVWQSIINGLRKAKTNEITLADAHTFAQYLKDSNVLETTQKASRIFNYYRSLGAKEGGSGYLAKRWLTIK